jgi:glycosyltransferase involved in cell wall biosynthesis
LLVPPRDPKSLAEATSYLLEKPLTEDMGKNGYLRAITLFSEDKVSPIIESVYKEAISHGV